MSNQWQTDLINLLKYLEKKEPNKNKILEIHEFRRALESCNIKKTEKLLPQLSTIYQQCQSHFDNDFDTWIYEQTFKLKLGLRTVDINSSVNSNEYLQHIKWVLSYFQPDLCQINRPIVINTTPTGLPVSGKQLKMAMKKVNGMNNDRLSSMISKMPQSQLESLASNPAAEGIVSKIKLDKRAQSVANKIKEIKGISEDF